jgi:hypothetical protein
VLTAVDKEGGGGGRRWEWRMVAMGGASLVLSETYELQMSQNWVVN